uniref:Uncharacterized protein n=1 Tax=Anguilla anguilla TaxID=7936 RepID=A0A0E9R011_ANGAN
MLLITSHCCHRPRGLEEEPVGD